MQPTIHIQAPSRIHYGMLSFGHGGRRQYGGVGLMVNEPRLELTIQPAGELSISGPLSKRIQSFVRYTVDHWQLPKMPSCAIRVKTAPSEHHGLGCGTQLALSVAAGLRAFLGMAPASESALAASVGRGRRSSVGVWGFFHGGLIYESGHAAGESLGALVARVPFPENWRLVLIRAPGPIGKSGEEETKAFADLLPVPNHVTRQLENLVTWHLIPAAKAAAYDEFSESVFEYGRLAGECFAKFQGGPFASPAIAQLVDTLQGWSVRGVGQSSWGPTVFAIARNVNHADMIVEKIRNQPAWTACEISVTEPCNTGARIKTIS
ncbi:MAG: hypothetical protein JW829_03490 [Pirellulales bacterium]|nr:hypothetical protein [Pirellulales bacterium]